MPHRICDVQARAEHRDRDSIQFQGGPMRCGVDPPRETADDARARAHECAGQLPRDPLTVWRRTASPDNSDSGSDLQLIQRSTQPEVWRSIFTQVFELARIARIVSLDAQFDGAVVRVTQPSPRPWLVHSPFAFRAVASTTPRAATRVPAARRS